jgi:folate-binding protein YgfZ
VPTIEDVIATTDYERLRETVGLVDRSARGKLWLTGTEALDYLQGQVTNDVAALAPRTGCYAALLNHKGKMLTDMRVVRGDDFIWIDTEPEGLPALTRNASMFSIGRDVRREDVTEAWSILSLIGPEARAVLDAPPPAVENEAALGEHGLYVATDLGVDVICRTETVAAVREALGVEEVSEEAAECLRIESGRPRFSIDVGTDTIPQEAGLNERAVSFTKGCYVGQETVARLHYKGKPNRHLRGLRLAAPVERGDEIRFGDRVVGQVGSTAVSPVNGPIALALVRREAEPGADVHVGGAAIEGRVAELPFTG